MSSSTIAINEIRRVLADMVRKELNASASRAVPEEVRVLFVVNALLTILTWWLERKPGLAPSEVDAIFRQLVANGIGRP